MKPIYFDLTVRNLGAARRFFEHIFGWQFERFPMPYEYYRIQAGSADEQGIDGGIGAVDDTAVTGGEPLTQLTINVPDIDEFISKIVASGGQIVEDKMPIQGIGWYATCAEPGGLKFGMLQIDSEVR